MIYLGLFSLLSTLRFALIGMRRARLQLYPLVLTALFLFSAFRLDVGCDWTGYLFQYQLYRDITLSDALSNREPLWLGLFMAQHWLGLPYPWINVASSFIFFAGVHVLARRQPDPLAFLILLFPVLIVNMPMSGIRQGAAIGVMCMAFVAFIDRAPLRFVALTLIASGLHASAIIFLLLAPLVTGGYSRKQLALAALLAVPGALALFSGGSAELATSRYVNTGVDAYGALYRTALLFITALFYFVFIRKKWFTYFYNDYKLVTIGSLMMIATLMVLPISSVISDRIGYYPIPIQTMIFARIPFLGLKTNAKLFFIAPYIGLFVFFGVWTLLSFHFKVCYVPYDSWILSGSF